jgi:hypothetical protein
VPDLPEGMYPALLQTVFDHDVRFGDYVLNDFSVSPIRCAVNSLALTLCQRAAIEFPFVDLLSDNATSFRWSPTMFLTSNAPMAIHGAEEYGTNVYPAVFEPPCNAYEPMPDGDGTYFNAKSVSGDAFMDTIFQMAKFGLDRFPIDFFVNATNQPSFADGTICDEYIRYFNTSLSKDEYAPVPVTGTVKTRINLFEEEMVWENAVGMRIDTAFLENHLVSCESLRGYTGVGEQGLQLKESQDAPEEDWTHGELR